MQKSEKIDSAYIAGRNVKWDSYSEQFDNVRKNKANTIHVTTIRSSNYTPGHLAQGN